MPRLLGQGDGYNWRTMDTVYDVVIVGAGPIGLAATCAAQDAGLTYLLLDKAGICQTIVEWAPRQDFYSPAEELEVGNLLFYIGADAKPRREDALAYYRAVVRSRNLNIHTWEKASSVRRGADGVFQIRTVQQPDAAWHGEYRSRSVLLTSGVWDQPNALPVPGATLKKVSRRYVDPTPYYGKRCLVVGGGNSAAEVAMALSRVGAETTLCLLERSWDECSLRPFVRRDLTMMADDKKLDVHFGTQVCAITPLDVTLGPVNGGEEWTMPNDFVFSMIGAIPDVAFLCDAGVDVDPADHKPVYSTDTFETNVPGLYVAGSIARDQHIVNGRATAVGIVERIAAQVDKQG